MTVEKNQVVTLSYTLNSLDSEGNKTLIEETNQDNALSFLYGAGMMIPKFEEEISGLSAGDKKSFVILPDEGYGEINQNAVTALPMDMFKESGEPPVGAVLPLQDQNGNQLHGVVTAVEADQVLVDLNHPMAGKTLAFDIEILALREATEEELAHGHAHGADGHGAH
ncbi:FKBP-type peptidyl-prolyl cis-trans isomerase [Planobacterium oryzisoli]|uniref:Peptidyl-prolyl cis-trans isomerase n=1 Tax=Planobacterium oryzisoli TaxID=2771435 RepID=A0A930YVF7_9FLAO|nr:peptidylprolyl isomerase [Planobacterium oryzisoli]MBF5027041.1 peptidylprolyl isomerase [Planobacterium oryzisoli]